jgi:hypothetical protein
MAASMVHVTNLTPGSDHPTDRKAAAAELLRVAREMNFQMPSSEQQVGLHSLPGGVRLNTWTILAVVNSCF